MGEVGRYGWCCRSGVMPDSSFGQFPSLTPRSFQQKSRFLGSLTHTLVSADTSALRKSFLSCDFPAKAAPGAQHLHQLLSQHAAAGGPGVGHVVVDPPCPGFSPSLIWTAKSQPGLLPLITQGPGLQQPAAVRLVHHYRHAAQGLSRYSGRLLLCVFAENYASFY